MGEDGPLWRPTEEVVRQTSMRAFMARHGLSDIDDLLRQAEARPRWYWESLIDFFDIRFDAPFTDVLDISDGIEWPKWCVGGTTNVAANCLDRHRGTPAWSKPAIVWEGEDGATRRWSYAELSRETDRLAGLLRGRGVGRATWWRSTCRWSPKRPPPCSPSPRSAPSPCRCSPASACSR